MPSTFRDRLKSALEESQNRAGVKYQLDDRVTFRLDYPPGARSRESVENIFRLYRLPAPTDKDWVVNRYGSHDGSQRMVFKLQAPMNEYPDEEAEPSEEELESAVNPDGLRTTTRRTLDLGDSIPAKKTDEGLARDVQSYKLVREGDDEADKRERQRIRDAMFDSQMKMYNTPKSSPLTHSQPVGGGGGRGRREQRRR